MRSLTIITSLTACSAMFVFTGISAMAQTERPVFSADSRKLPNGGTDGVVRLKIGSYNRVVMDVPNQSGGLSQEARAKKIAERLQKLSDAHPNWWKSADIRTDFVRREQVVKVPGAPDPWIVTVDNLMARFLNAAPVTAAGLIISGLRSSLDSDSRGKFKKGPAEMELSTRHEQANQNFQEAVDFCNHQQYEYAAAKYRDAILFMPDYAQAWEDLAKVYDLMNEPAKAVDAKKNAALFTRAFEQKKQGDDYRVQAAAALKHDLKIVADTNYKKAIESYEAANEIAQKNCLTYWLLIGDTYKDWGKEKEMREVYTAAKKQLYPNGKFDRAPVWGAEFLDKQLK